MAVLTRQVQRCEPRVVDAVHKAVAVEEDLYDIVVSIPSCLMEGSVAKLW